LSAPLRYLRQLGVDVEQAVKMILVTHWDDDHVKGIADVVEACPNADFVSSIVFSAEKFTCFVEAITVGAMKTDGGNVQNIRKVLQLLKARNKPIKAAAPARQLCSNPVIRCWSPSDLDANDFLMYVARMHPKAGEGLRKAIPSTPNLASVVLTIEWPDGSVLLGADMEHSADVQRGWGAVVSEAMKIGVAPGNFVKIPHHGSETGHDDGMWEHLLHKHPVSVLTPFGRGAIKGRPPKSSDVRRISKNSGKMYISARHTVSPTRPKMDLAVERSIREGLITLTSQKTPIGIVRHRRVAGADWRCELFGAAFRVK